MADGENLSADQNEKLAYFQEITHIESLDECRQILEAFEWNMESAVQNTFNDMAPVTPSSSTSSTAAMADQPQVNGPLHTPQSSQSDLEEFLARANRPNAPPPAPPTPVAFYQNRSQQSLPNVNVLQPRTITYPSGGALVPAAPPQGVFQWSLFLVAFPFKFFVSTLYDLASFFFSIFFDRTPPIPIDYDPLANIAEFTIDYNQKFGTNHPEFFVGSYSQVFTKSILAFLVYL